MLDSILKNKHLNKLEKDKPVVIALSGGVDSMVLFHLLRSASFKIVIAHVNHHKREQSIIEEAYIRKLGSEYNIAVEVFDYFHEKNNFQAEAHNQRYNFFYEGKLILHLFITSKHYVESILIIYLYIR